MMVGRAWIIFESRKNSKPACPDGLSREKCLTALDVGYIYFNVESLLALVQVGTPNYWNRDHRYTLDMTLNNL